MIFDTYTWVEFFLGTETGKNVKDLMKKEEPCTSVLSLPEIVVWCLKNNLNYAEYLSAVKQSSTILFANEKICESAGRINYERRKTIKDFGMIDSLIYSTAIYYGLKLVTGDLHFKGLENTIII